MNRVYRPLMGLGIAFFAFTLLFHAWWGPDIWYHLFLGRGILQTGQILPADQLFISNTYFVNVYWFFQIVCYFFYKTFGLGGITFLFMGFWLLIFKMSFKMMDLKNWGAVGGVMALMALLTCKPRFEYRPEVFSYLCMSLELFLLTQINWSKGPTRIQMLFYFLIQVFWSNVHGYFIFGPLFLLMMIGSLVVETFINPSQTTSIAWKKILILFGIVFAATFVSPLGVGTWGHAFNTGAISYRIEATLDELKPPTGEKLQMIWSLYVFWGYWILSALAMVGLFIYKRGALELFSILICGMGLYLSASGLRYVPLIVMMTALLWGRIFFYSRESFQKIKPWNPSLGIAIFAVSVGLGIWTIQGGMSRTIASSSEFGIKLSDSSYPKGVVEYLKRNGFERGTLLAGSSENSFLEYHFPEMKLMMDSRLVGDPDRVQQYVNGIHFPQEFQKVFSWYPFDGVLLRLTSSYPVVTELLKNPQFQLNYADLHYAFFINKNSQAGSRLPVHPPVFYQNQDLRFKTHTGAVVTWALALENQSDPRLFKELTRQMMASTQIPSTFLVTLLGQAYKRKDHDMRAWGLSMRDRVFISAPTDEWELADLSRLLSP